MNFADLTWEDLKDWAGDRVVARGKGYLRRVENLRVTADGALLAWVEGGDRYATRVRIDEGGTLASDCTCPYAPGPCKHAVAVTLAYLDARKNNREPAKAEPDDERFAIIAEGQDDLDDECIPSEESARPTKEDEAVRKHLEGLSKGELVNLVLEGRNIIPELRQQLADRLELKEGNVAKLIASARREIEKASRDAGWTNHWRGESHRPDYSRVTQRLENLLAAGHPDAVVELGDYVMARGLEQVGQSNDEGETGQEIAGSMAVAFKAITRSSLSVSERLLWEIDLRLRDDCGLLDGLSGPVEAGQPQGKDHWSKVADSLAIRLAKMPRRPEGNRAEYASTYRREQVMRWLLRALENAGRSDEVIPVLEREVAETQCYEKLVEKLIEAGCVEKAGEWARKGFVETLEGAPGVAWNLVGKLYELAVRVRDYPLAAAYRAMEFFDRPSLQRYCDLQKSATKAGVWEMIRDPILAYLETGRRPDTTLCVDALPSRRRRGKPSGVPAVETVKSGWPLPAPGLPVAPRAVSWARVPDLSTLIDIALEEGRNSEALRWYRQGRQQRTYGPDHEGEKVARGVVSTHPDDAIAIWKDLAAAEISRTKPSAYHVAGGYLKKIRAALDTAKRTSEWTTYLAKLRAQNVRRPRMMDVLNSLEGRRTPIVSG
jgi:uncharacterized Zn finger protein